MALYITVFTSYKHRHIFKHIFNLQLENALMRICPHLQLQELQPTALNSYLKINQKAVRTWQFALRINSLIKKSLLITCKVNYAIGRLSQTYSESDTHTPEPLTMASYLHRVFSEHRSIKLVIKFGSQAIQKCYLPVPFQFHSEFNIRMLRIQIFKVK